MTKHDGNFTAVKSGRWNSAEDAILRDMLEAGEGYAAIATDLGRGVGSVTMRANRLGANPAAVALAAHRKVAESKPEPAPDTSLAGQLRASTYADRARMAAEQGWTTVQTQQRYHRAMAGEAV